MAENTISDTKRDIILAASSCFANRGYKDTTIRSIAAKAGVNIAAINYHFGDKERLYLEVLRYWVKDAFKSNPFQAIFDESLSLEKRLRSFIYDVLLCVVGPDGSGTGFGRLITLESAFFPTDMIRQIIQESIGEPTEQLLKVVEALLGESATEEKVHFYSASIVGQTVFYYVSRHLNPILFHLEPVAGGPQLDRIADSICRFSLDALEAERKRGPHPPLHDASQ